jgi:hypothetical protein
MPEIEWKHLWNDPDGKKFQAINTVTYFSKRYNRGITVEAGYKSDGATGAWDVATDAWGFHDVLCDTGKWDDGSLVCNWVASTVLGDILWRDGHKFRAVYWWWATYLFGGGKARENGMRRVRHG